MADERSMEEILYQRIVLELARADDGIAALMAAEVSKLSKQKGERDTEFVKRIAKAYNQHAVRLFMMRNHMELGEMPHDLVHRTEK